jgi:hypothetical protein
MMNNWTLRFILLSLSPLLLCTPAVVNAQWEPDVRLTFNNRESNTVESVRCVASVPGGNVYAVWFDTRDLNNEIYFKRSTDWGVTWTPDTRLTYQDRNSLFPAIAATGSDIHVVWEDERDNLKREIYYKRSTDSGVTWSQDVRLTYNDSVDCYPNVYVLNADVHVIWTAAAGKQEVYHKRSTDRGLTWTPEARLSNLPGESWATSLALSGTTAHLIFHNCLNNNWEVYYRRSTDGGTSWSSERRLSDSLNYSWYPSIAGAGSNLFLAWGDQRDGNAEIYFKRSSDLGVSWSPDTRLTADSASSEQPCITGSGNNVHVVWIDTRDGDYEIYYKRSTDAGATWSSDTRLTNDPLKSWWASVSAADSVVHVLWSDYRDGNYEIYYKRNPTGNIGVEELSSSRLTPYASRLKVFPNPFTTFVILPGHSSERFALYDVSGRRVGTYRGDRIGVDVPQGVYFLRKLDGGTPPARIVKVR